MKFVSLIVGLWYGFLANGAHADLTDFDIAFFLEESYAQYGNRRPDHIDELMYGTMEKFPNIKDFPKNFAAQLGVTEDQAIRYAEAIIEGTRFRETCRETGLLEDCRFEQGSVLHNALTTVGLTEQTGQIATVIGKRIGGVQDPTGHNSVVFLSAIVEHPAHDAILTELFHYGHDMIWYAASVAEGDHNVEIHQSVLAHWSDNFTHQGIENQNGSWAALSEYGADTARARGRVQNAIFARQVQLMSLLSNGMTDAALQVFTSLPDEERARFFTEASNIKKLKLRRRTMRAVYQLGNDIVAAMIFQDGQSRTRAQVLFQEVRTMEDAALKQSAQSKVLQDIFERNFDPSELYDLYLYGVTSESGRPAYLIRDELLVKDRTSAPESWRFALQRSGPHLTWVLANRLEEAGANGLATQIREDFKFLDWTKLETPPSLVELSAPLPAGHRARKASWGQKISASRAFWEGRRSASGLASAADGYAIESVVPPAFTVSGGTEGSCSREFSSASIPLPSDLPIQEEQVVQYEERDRVRAVVFISGEYDRPGEIPGWGYFVQFDQRDNGWERPIYLGLQMHFPYVLLPASQISMLDQDGRLRLEAHLSEIDMTTVTFPPVRLGLKRERCGVILDFDLAALTKDSDGDWITDIAEARLGMNPFNADSDLDGIPDGFDSLPLTHFDPLTARIDTLVAVKLLEAMMGIQKHAIMVGIGDSQLPLPRQGKGVPPNIATEFLVADPKLFSGVSLPFRLLVYRSHELAKLGRGDAPFFVPEIGAMFTRPDDSEKYVIWSAGWAGGTFIVRCDPVDGCEIVVLEEWIT